MLNVAVSQYGKVENVKVSVSESTAQMTTAYGTYDCLTVSLSANTIFAGGVWTWSGFLPQVDFTWSTMEPALRMCAKHKVKTVFATMWGDDGGECSHFSQLPALFYLAQYAKGNRDEESIKAKFKRFCGLDYDEFMAIDRPNEVYEYEGMPRNPSKYMFYSDYFNDFLDCTVTEGEGQKYQAYADALHATAKKSRTYGYVFDSVAKLCDVLVIKYELGLRTRKAYEAGDKAELERLAKNEYVQVAKRIEIFAKAFEKQWMMDNKAQGFDVQDHRIGGLLRRNDSCRRRILDYVNGKIDRIDELEEKLLPFGDEMQLLIGCTASWTATTNILYHGDVVALD